MINFISWQQYLTAISILTVVYYLLVWILVFKAKSPFRQQQSNGTV